MRPSKFANARALRALRRFSGARGGAAAVEFALVAAPFFFMLFAVLEVALIFFVSTVLEHSTTEASREIRTGRFQASGSGEEEFRQAVCDRLLGLFDCDNLSIDVRTFADFEAVDPEDPFDDEGEVDDEEFEFQPGGARQIVLVRVFYEWQLVTPVLGDALSNMSGGRRLMTAATAFRNEPF